MIRIPAHRLRDLDAHGEGARRRRGPAPPGGHARGVGSDGQDRRGATRDRWRIAFCMFANQFSGHPCSSITSMQLAQPITITGASVFVNPYKELLEEEAKAAAAKSATVSIERVLHWHQVRLPCIWLADKAEPHSNHSHTLPCTPPGSQRGCTGDRISGTDTALLRPAICRRWRRRGGQILDCPGRPGSGRGHSCT